MDTAVAEAFADRFVDALNGGALCLMTSLGHRAGLFDALADTGPVSAEQLAERAGLNDRYVREWLGAMTTARVVHCDPQTGLYELPVEHACSLTRAAGADNMAVFAQYIGLLGGVEDDILECFEHGGGVPYERFPRFHAVMAEDSGQSVLPVLESHIVPLVPGLAERLEAGIDVLDVGCGRGRALMRLAERYPRSRFTGYDLSAEALAWAGSQAREAGLANLRFEVRDLSDFDKTAEPAAYDFVTTFDAVHDQARPQRVLDGIARTLRDDGVYLMQDIDASSHHHDNLEHPLGTLLYTVSCMHCMTVSLAQDGDGLGAMWGREKASAMLEEAGFRDVTIHRLDHDPQNAYYVNRKG